MVLDEPTVSIDAEAEAEIFGKLREIAAGATAVLIAHRFSTVRMADEILVLEQGALIERGSHGELMRLNGAYARGSVGCGTMTPDAPRDPKRGGAASWEDLVARYARADADEPDAYTFSVIAGRTEDEVIRAFGGDPGASRLMTFAESVEEQAAHLYEDYELLRVLTVDRHVIAIEWGCHGSIPEVARRTSADGGEFFSVYRNVNARYQVMHAFDGRVDGMFDPFELEDAAWMDPEPDTPAWAEGVVFHMETLCAESFALMERTMGVAIDPEWMSTALRTVRLTSPSELFSQSEAAWLP
ncbi:DUF6461 domain-containing protein [Streptomyces sp. NBC_00557]|uniref:DUF6461 domain-containing protein n=1 Tax=Streptomyces sp. NBC_00557 TaxID=2975776 RepID=UPI002E81BDFD|nr:DUF6461 domain-containing protein [Streptomyces sp. NBC_00557]WUC35641.1 DUF6461 domain-containing protein [Streptomyces sp. NBC_00557]